MAPEDLIEEGDAAYHAYKEGLASGGRVPLSGGGDPINPLDPQFKLADAIKVYQDYYSGPGKKKRKIPFKRFFEIYAKENFATGGRVPRSMGGISDSRVGMLFGGGIWKTIIKNLAKERGVDPSTYLKITNYKALPNEVKKYISKAEFEKMKAGRIEMFENWVEMAKTRKAFLENIKQGKKNEFTAPIFEHLEKSFKSPVPHGVTDKDILQGEFILKNLKTKDRKLHASGGLAGMLGE
jgi:hypothetical protein